MITTASEVYGLILIGGKSSRMQMNKSEMVYGHLPQWRFCFELLTPLCSQVFLSAGAGRIPEGVGDESIIYDIFSEPCGPLGAIISAFKRNPNKAWWVLACDMPFFDSDAARYLLDRREPSKQATAFISPRDSHPEPLSTIYEPEAFSPLLTFWASGSLCPRKLLNSMDVRRVTPEHSRWLDNANTPQEFAAAKTQLLEATV